MAMKSVCVYSGAHPGGGPYVTAAEELGAEIAARGIELVYGGGSTGLMGALADGALAVGGAVVGVIPGFLATRELLHDGLSRVEVVADMHTRKARMVALADGFIGLPGGLGTFEELLECLTWAQLGLHSKPVGLLNTQGYYDALLVLLEHAVREGFVERRHRDRLIVADEPADILDAVIAHAAPAA
jgi:uncharacterized protein (TIGR00730 family)